MKLKDVYLLNVLELPENNQKTEKQNIYQGMICLILVNLKYFFVSHSSLTFI